MASRAPQTPTLKAARFLEANRASPLVYQSYDEAMAVTTFRLADGRRFELTLVDCLSIGGVELRWRHLEAA